MKLRRLKFRSSFLAYDSYMIKTKDLKIGKFRKLEVDKPIVIHPWRLYTFITTSSDVIHSFSLPTLGIKLDSVPGRLKETKTLALLRGIYFGQCSELCGVKHSFMPIKLECFKFFKKFYVKSSPRYQIPSNNQQSQKR